jgi:MFS family permease
MNPPDRDVERRAVPLLLLLAGVSGLVDAASYLRLGHVFVANMTGNVIFVGFALAGATGLSLASSAAAIGSFLAGIATTFIAIALVDRIGRKPLLFAGSAGMVITLGVLAFLFGTAPLVSGQPHLGAVTGPIALVAANLYVVAFGFSWGPVVWVLLGEMFPNRIRAIAVSGSRRRAMAGEFCGVDQLSAPSASRTWFRLRALHSGCAAFDRLRVVLCARDQGKRMETM